MPIPSWVRKRLSQDRLLKEHSSKDEPFFDLLITTLRQYSFINVPLVPINTSRGSIELIRHRITNETLLIWDYQFFYHFDITLSILLASQTSLDRVTAQHMNLRSVSIQVSQILLPTEPGFALSCERLSAKMLGRRQLPRQLVLSDIQVFDRIRKLCRVFVLLHEFGHAVYRVEPDLLANIDEKMDIVATNIGLTGSRFFGEKERHTGNSGQDAAQQHHNKIKELLISERRREETWCDFFSVEQLILWCMIEEYTVAECYLAVMLVHYIITTRQVWEYFWDRHNNALPWYEHPRLLEAKVRGDVRGQFCLVQAHHLCNEPLGISVEDYRNTIVNESYPIMKAYTEIAQQSLGLLHSIYREEALTHSDTYWHGLGLQEKDDVIRRLAEP